MRINLEHASLDDTGPVPALAALKPAAVDSSYASPASCLYLPYDDAALEEIEALAETKASEVRYVVLVGIGGSNLGAKAVYDAVLGKGATRELILLEGVEGDSLRLVERTLEQDQNPDNYLFVCVSKSGQTLETAANLEALTAIAGRYFDPWPRTVVVSDAGSALAEMASSRGVSFLPIPKAVGGRFSVFSAAGLLPLACCGIDVRGLAEGARRASGLWDAAGRSAASAFGSYRRGVSVFDTFVFGSRLESLAKWRRQLTAESLGKESDRSGREVRIGYLPTVTVGSADLHSVGQLYFGGPKSRFTYFVYSDSEEFPALPSERQMPNLADEWEKLDLAQARRALVEGVQAAYGRAGLPAASLVLEGYSPAEIGEYLQFSIMETLVLAELLDVDAFDQPAVESYKRETRLRLAGRVV